MWVKQLSEIPFQALNKAQTQQTFWGTKPLFPKAFGLCLWVNYLFLPLVSASWMPDWL